MAKKYKVGMANMKYKVAKMNRTTSSLSHIFNTCHMCSRDTVAHVHLPSTCIVVTSYHDILIDPSAPRRGWRSLPLQGAHVSFNIGKGIDTSNCIFYLIDGF